MRIWALSLLLVIHGLLAKAAPLENAESGTTGKSLSSIGLKLRKPMYLYLYRCVNNNTNVIQFC